MGSQLTVTGGKATHEEKNVPFLVLSREIEHGYKTNLMAYNWKFAAFLLPEVYPQKRNDAILLDCKVLRTIMALK